MSFKDIESATQKFSPANDIGGGSFGRVYRGELKCKHGSSTIVAKRLDTRGGQGDQQFYNELHILSEYKHENVIGLVGYNNDEQERIIVYEYASKRSLDNYLNDASLTWINRLNICIDVARGLAFLHGGVLEHEASLVKQRREEGRLDEVVFNALKNQIVPEALAIFQAIGYQCLHDDREKRPTAQHVLVQIQMALELQLLVRGSCVCNLWSFVRDKSLTDGGLIGKRVGNVLQQKTEAVRCFGTSIVVEETGSTVRDDGGDR
ncbi:protein kinase-like domain, concanavalin A-like lectin/glucanase domain protein [Tanacetum coccineum]|uniref:Protein kinase-like domain, concanavalin A-like lectin/glucanase domain protein n=1 Tax=Tanacetum coccineum TaxID=301880 RepID=A0ABQ5B4E8_9ASTR